MNIVIISGSPKGTSSISLQYAEYIKAIDKKNNYETLEVGKYIKVLEKTKSFFDSYMETIKNCDALIWVTPVYSLLPPYALVKFINLIYENSAQNNFINKYATSIITSEHLFDTTAENYLQLISEDIGMLYLKGHTPGSKDILSKKGEEALVNFFKKFEFYFTERIDIERCYTIKPSKILKYETIVPEYIKKEKSKYKILVITEKEENRNLTLMTNFFTGFFPLEIETVNLDNMKIRNSCNGCLKCVVTGHCNINDKFEDFYKNKFMKADCVIISAQIKSHAFSDEWKIFYDRTFCNGYKISNKRRLIAYIISGALSGEPVLYDFIQQRTALFNQTIIGIVTDEDKSNTEINSALKSLSKKIIYALKNNFANEINFYSLASNKIIKDYAYKYKDSILSKNDFLGVHQFDEQTKKSFKNKIESFFIKFLSKKDMEKILSKKTASELTKIKKLIDSLQ